MSAVTASHENAGASAAIRPPDFGSIERLMLLRTLSRDRIPGSDCAHTPCVPVWIGGYSLHRQRSVHDVDLIPQELDGAAHIIEFVKHQVSDAHEPDQLVAVDDGQMSDVIIFHQG